MKRVVSLLLAALASGAVLAQQDGATEPNPATAPTTTTAPTTAPVPATAEPQVPATPVEASPAPAPAATTPAPSTAGEPAAPPVPAVPAVPTEAVTADTPPAVPAQGAPVAPMTPPPWKQPPALLDGRWEGSLHAAITGALGRNNSQTYTLGADAVYHSGEDKLSLYANYLQVNSQSINNGVATTSVSELQWRAGTRYDGNLSPQDFGFVGLEFNQDIPQRLLLRSSISTGLGRHRIKTATEQWDLLAGLSYRADQYAEPGAVINGEMRSNLFAFELLFGEESTHKLGDTSSFKQKLVVYPSLGMDRGVRATFDAGLLFDINSVLAFNVKLQGRYDSLVEDATQRYDLLLFTGVSLRFKE